MNGDALSPAIRVLLVDDHSLFRSGIAAVLQHYPGLCIVGEAADGAEGIALAQSLRPDVVLLDLHMPGLSGVATLRRLREQKDPAAVLMLTVSEQAADLALALGAGACGYLIKNIDGDYLARAIARAAAGETVVAEAMTDKLVAQLQQGVATSAADLARLTPREREVLACLAKGDSNKLIARALGLAESTVKIHVQNVLKKLHLNNRVQAAVFAVGQDRPHAPAPDPV